MPENCNNFCNLTILGVNLAFVQKDSPVGVYPRIIIMFRLVTATTISDFLCGSFNPDEKNTFYLY